AVGGPGTAGIGDGVGIVTDGWFYERVKGNASSEIQGELELEVTKKAEETFHDTLTIKVDKDAKLECDQKITVMGKSEETTIKQEYKLTTGIRTETVKGDYTVNMPDNVYTMNAFHKQETLLGDRLETTHGRETVTKLGVAATTYIGGWHSYYVGAKIEMT